MWESHRHSARWHYISKVTEATGETKNEKIDILKYAYNVIGDINMIHFVCYQCYA